MITQSQVLQALSKHIGRDRGVGAIQLVRECLALGDELVHAEREPRSNMETYQRNVRDLITELRNQGHHICSHPATGYFMAETPEELNEACKFLVDRALCSLKQVAAMKNVALPDLYGQLKLPT